MAEEKKKQKPIKDKAGRKKIRVSMLVEPKEWELFQKIANLLDTDASKANRRLVREYIEENKHILEEEK